MSLSWFHVTPKMRFLEPHQQGNTIYTPYILHIFVTWTFYQQDIPKLQTVIGKSYTEDIVLHAILSLEL